MDPVTIWLEEVAEKESNGELTFKDAPIGSYLEFIDGSRKGRVVLKMHPFAQIDGYDITWFARETTWIKVSDIENELVHRIGVTFHGTHLH